MVLDLKLFYKKNVKIKKKIYRCGRYEEGPAKGLLLHSQAGPFHGPIDRPMPCRTRARITIRANERQLAQKY